MKHFSFLKNIFFAFAALALVVSCDDSFDLLGSDVVDADIHNNIVPWEGNVLAYDQKFGPVQTSNTSTNLLGSYNSVFGRTTASYVTQVQLATVAPSLTNHIHIDSVWVYVPFASTLTSSETNSTTNEVDNIYKINSYYGNLTDKFKLRIAENKYFIRGIDPTSSTGDTQLYYSDQSNDFTSNQGQSLLPNGQNDTIISFSDKEIKRRANYTDSKGTLHTGIIAERLTPGLFFPLDTTFFKNKVLDPTKASQLSTNAAFAEYFRGVSFFVEQDGTGSTMLAPTFTSGYIKVVYNQDVYSNGAPVYETDDNGNPTTTIKTVHLTMTINLKGNHINLFKNEDSSDYLQGVTNSDATNGDSRLYLRGGEGSIALLDVFSETQRTNLKAQNVLINEANLKFYVDSATPYDSIPNRVYLYDLTNKRPLYDYYSDGTTGSTAKLNKQIYSGILAKDEAGSYYYKVRLTNHINNVINKDSTLVKLGLVLTDDITTSANLKLKTPFTGQGVNVTVVPTANVITPLGVKLFGPNIPAGDQNYDKRLKLEIFYTKPEN